MPTQTAPIKVDAATDRLISDSAHFLGRSKKDLVTEAVREYIEAHRSEIDTAVREAFARLDGTNVAAVSLFSGLSPERLAELGGVPEDK